MAQRERVAFLGLGIMGRPQAANLVRAGFEVIVWNRTRSRADEFANEFSSSVAHTPADAAGKADITITMVPDVPEVEEVLFGDEGAARGMRRGGLAIDMSTISPAASQSIGERLRAEGIGFLDAPVSGSRPRAEAGTLTIMAGGEEEDFRRARPLLDAMGELVVHVGPQGHGSLVKLINNTLAAINAAALAEALTMAESAGVDTDALRRVVAASSGGSAMLELKAGPMIEGDYEPLFKLEHMLKDVRHYLEAAQSSGTPAALASVAEQLYARAERRGLGGKDFAAVMAAVENDSATPGT
ncbi:MAG: 3-hydroxyisobutyrate dehydrogenase [Thermoleophilaceae bacterium]|nr:3-hydroxyisobutyrate dehydrogenase [Thermoleophilaceae bacterium]